MLLCGSAREASGTGLELLQHVTAAGRAWRRVGGFAMSTEVHPVDEILPVPRLLALGLQHVLVMYAGAVAVPLIIGARAEAAARSTSPF